MHSSASMVCLFAVFLAFHPTMTQLLIPLSPQAAAIMQASLIKTNAFIAADIVKQIADNFAQSLVDQTYFLARAADAAVHDAGSALDAVMADSAVLPLLAVKAASDHVAALAQVNAYQAAIAAFMTALNAALTLSNVG